MFISPGFVYQSSIINTLFGKRTLIKRTSLININAIFNFNIKTKFSKITKSQYFQYDCRKSTTIKLYFIDNFIDWKDIKTDRFIIAYSDEKEFNKFKKENPELRYDTFNEILEIEKDYDNRTDFWRDFKDRVQNMIHY
jgi:hypothetical protein